MTHSIKFTSQGWQITSSIGSLTVSVTSVDSYADALLCWIALEGGR